MTRFLALLLAFIAPAAFAQVPALPLPQVSPFATVWTVAGSGVGNWPAWWSGAVAAGAPQANQTLVTLGTGLNAFGSPVATAGTNLSGWTPAGNFGVAPSATGVTVSAGARIGPGVSVAAPVSGAQAAAAIGRFATKIATPLNIGIGLYDLARDLGFFTKNDTGALVVTKEPIVAGAYDVSAQYPGFQSSVTACASTYGQPCGILGFNATSPNCGGVARTGPGACVEVRVVSGKTPAPAPGFYVYTAAWYPNVTLSVTPVPATLQQLTDAIALKSGWPITSTSLARSVADAIKSGEVVETGSPTVTGPATSPGKTVTTTNADGTKVVSTTTNNYTYNGPLVTTTTTTTNNTYNTSNVITSTTTTTTADAPQPPETSPADTPLGAIPKLYKPLYPLGLVGVWDDKKAQLKSTQLANLATSLAPSSLGSGGCPQFSLPVNIGPWHWGTYSLGPPCMVWDFLKVVTIIGAMFLARRLVFGG